MYDRQRFHIIYFYRLIVDQILGYTPPYVDKILCYIYIYILLIYLN